MRVSQNGSLLYEAHLPRSRLSSRTWRTVGLRGSGPSGPAGLLRDGIEIGYVRANIDVEAVADSIAAIPFGVRLRHGHEPEGEVLAARVRATADLVCRGIGSGTESSR